MWLGTMHSTLLSLTVLIASAVSVSANMADDILELEAECNSHIRQRDNAILYEEDDSFHTILGPDYFQCVNDLDILKRQYINDNLLGIHLDYGTFPIQLSNGTVLMVLVPPEQLSDSTNRSPDLSHLEEMCIMHNTCSRILEDWHRSVARKKEAEIKYLKVKRFYCTEILDRLQIKYIQENNINIALLKSLDKLNVLCNEGRTSMSLPDRIKDGTISFSSTKQYVPLKSSENSELKSSKGPLNDEFYNQIDMKIYNHYAVSKPNDNKDSQTPSEEETTNREETGQVIDSRNDGFVSHDSKKIIPYLDHVIPVDPSFLVPEKDNSIKYRSEDDTLHVPEVDNAITSTSFDDTLDEPEVDNTIASTSVDDTLHVPEVDNSIDSDNNWKTPSSQILNTQNTKSPVMYDELEHDSFYMKAAAVDFNTISNSATSPQVEERVNTDDVFENNNDHIFGEAKHNDDVKTDDTNLIINTDEANKNDGSISKHNDKTSNIINSELEMKDKIVEGNDGKVNVDINKNSEKVSDNSEDNNNRNYMKIITDKFIQNEKNFSSKDMVKVKDSNTNKKSDNGDSKIDKVNVDTSGVSSDNMDDKAESGEGVSVSRINTKSTSPGVLNESSNHRDPIDNDPSDDQQLEEPRLDYSLTPITDTLGDEVFRKDQDCQELLAVGTELLKQGSVTYLDDEYTDCLNKLNELKLVYIKHHGIDLEKYKTKFPLVLSTGAEELLSVPPLDAQSPQAAEHVFRDSEEAGGSGKKHNPGFNPILLSNEKFLEYFNHNVPSDEEEN